MASLIIEQRQIRQNGNRDSAIQLKILRSAENCGPYMLVMWTLDNDSEAVIERESFSEINAIQLDYKLATVTAYCDSYQHTYSMLVGMAKTDTLNNM